MAKDQGKLNVEITRAIAADIARGTFAHVAARRHGISAFTYHRWMNQGERDAKVREESEETESEPTKHELFWQAIEQAKAEARYNAETRVFDYRPEWWLSHGPARADWRPSGAMVRLFEEAVEKRVREIFERQDVLARWAQLDEEQRQLREQARQQGEDSSRLKRDDPAKWLAANPDLMSQLDAEIEEGLRKYPAPTTESGWATLRAMEEGGGGEVDRR